jgi:hypothetical protein
MRVMFGARGCARDAHWLLDETTGAALDAFVASIVRGALEQRACA